MHSDRNGEGGAGPAAVEQPLTWDDEDVAAPERFFAFTRTRCSFP